MWFAFAELAADQKNGALAMPSQKKPEKLMPVSPVRALTEMM